MKLSMSFLPIGFLLVFFEIKNNNEILCSNNWSARFTKCICWLLCFFVCFCCCAINPLSWVEQQLSMLIWFWFIRCQQSQWMIRIVHCQFHLLDRCFHMFNPLTSNYQSILHWFQLHYLWSRIGWKKILYLMFCWHFPQDLTYGNNNLS